jgi:peroxiredoxin Q/BCP
VREGEPAADFDLLSNSDRRIKLSVFRGKNVVLCFYPKNHLWGCPSKKVFEQARSIIENYERIKQLDAVLFGISVDTVESHKKFADEYKIPYPLLSDTDKSVCRKYAGLNMYGLAKRSTFIIDRNGIIVKVFRDIEPERHGGEIVAVLSGASQ